MKGVRWNLSAVTSTVVEHVNEYFVARAGGCFLSIEDRGETNICTAYNVWNQQMATLTSRPLGAYLHNTCSGPYRSKAMNLYVSFVTLHVI